LRCVAPRQRMTAASRRDGARRSAALPERDRHAGEHRGEKRGEAEEAPRALDRGADLGATGLEVLDSLASFELFTDLFLKIANGPRGPRPRTGNTRPGLPVWIRPVAGTSSRCIMRRGAMLKKFALRSGSSVSTAATWSCARPSLMREPTGAPSAETRRSSSQTVRAPGRARRARRRRRAPARCAACRAADSCP